MMENTTLSFDNNENRTKDVGVQVKTSSFISLQKKVVTITSETQTPNLETEDTYEAALLRGGPLKVHYEKPENKNMRRNQDENSCNSESPSINLERPCILKFYLNYKERERKESSLSERFKKFSSESECPLDDEKDNGSMCVIRASPERSNKPKTAKVMPTVGGKPVIPTVLEEAVPEKQTETITNIPLITEVPKAETVLKTNQVDTNLSKGELAHPTNTDEELRDDKSTLENFDISGNKTTLTDSEQSCIDSDDDGPNSVDSSINSNQMSDVDIKVQAFHTADDNSDVENVNTNCADTETIITDTKIIEEVDVQEDNDNNTPPVESNIRTITTKEVTVIGNKLNATADGLVDTNCSINTIHDDVIDIYEPVKEQCEDESSVAQDKMKVSMSTEEVTADKVVIPVEDCPKEIVDIIATEVDEKYMPCKKSATLAENGQNITMVDKIVDADVNMTDKELEAFPIEEHIVDMDVETKEDDAKGALDVHLEVSQHDALEEGEISEDHQQADLSVQADVKKRRRKKDYLDITGSKQSSDFYISTVHRNRAIRGSHRASPMRPSMSSSSPRKALLQRPNILLVANSSSTSPRLKSSPTKFNERRSSQPEYKNFRNTRWQKDEKSPERFHSMSSSSPRKALLKRPNTPLVAYSSSTSPRLKSSPTKFNERRSSQPEDKNLRNTRWQKDEKSPERFHSTPITKVKHRPTLAVEKNLKIESSMYRKHKLDNTTADTDERYIKKTAPHPLNVPNNFLHDDHNQSRDHPNSNLLQHGSANTPNSLHNISQEQEYFISQFVRILRHFGVWMGYPNGESMSLKGLKIFMCSNFNCPVAIVNGQRQVLSVEEVVRIFTVCPIRLPKLALRVIRERLGIPAEVWDTIRGVITQNVTVSNRMHYVQE